MYLMWGLYAWCLLTHFLLHSHFSSVKGGKKIKVIEEALGPSTLQAWESMKKINTIWLLDNGSVNMSKTL